MLTPITCLNEIVSMVPDAPRQFQINEEELMGIDPTKAIAARTFTGVLLKPDDDSRTDGETCKFIEVFYESGINIITLFTEEIRKQFFKDVHTTNTPSTKGTCNTRNLDTFNTCNGNRGDVNSWN